MVMAESESMTQHANIYQVRVGLVGLGDSRFGLIKLWLDVVMVWSG